MYLADLLFIIIMWDINCIVRDSVVARNFEVGEGGTMKFL